MSDGWKIEAPDEGEFSYGSVDITRDGVREYYAVPGQTGACWNIGEYVGGERGGRIHVCDLDEFIALLEALRDSDANRAQVERWEPPSAGIPEEAR